MKKNLLLCFILFFLIGCGSNAGSNVSATEDVAIVDSWNIVQIGIVQPDTASSCHGEAIFNADGTFSFKNACKLGDKCWLVWDSQIEGWHGKWSQFGTNSFRAWYEEYPDYFYQINVGSETMTYALMSVSDDSIKSSHEIGIGLRNAWNEADWPEYVSNKCQ